MAKQASRRLLTNPRTAGFTLIELMIIVVIIGVLSSIAIPTYRSYMYRSKTTEGVGFLADIKNRQESYRSEYLQYCEVSANSEAWWPTEQVNGYYHWDATELPEGWRHLGASPPGIYGSFQYVSIAGAPGTANRPSSRGLADNRGYDGNDFWFIGRARADLDHDGTFLTMEIYSAQSAVWMSESKGWE